jgi:IrrE N-terminal-like domain
VSPAPAEEAAGDLLNASGQTSPPADPRRVIALLRGLKFAVEPLDNDGYIVDVPGGAEILLNANAPATRQRFTLAHEIGHYALQIGLGDTTVLPSHSDVERWCDRFAVGLLMPEGWVKQFLRGVSAARMAGRVAAGPRTFQVSRAAFLLRVSEVAGVWAFELDSAGQLASDVRPEPPNEVLSLARDCSARAGSKSSSSIAAYGLRASCILLNSSARGDERSLVVVARDASIALPTG